jgi:hypothetical protein
MRAHFIKAFVFLLNEFVMLDSEPLVNALLYN